VGVVTASSSAARQRLHDCGLQQYVGSPLAATYHLCCGVQVGPPLSRCPALLPGVVLSMYLPAHAPCLIMKACSIKAWLHAPYQGLRPTKAKRWPAKAYLGRPLFSPLITKAINMVYTSPPRHSDLR
jgi:hypothetical protein